MSIVRTTWNTEKIVEDQDELNTSKLSGSGKIDFIHKQPKSLSIAMGSLGKKSVKQKVDTKLTVSTKLSNVGNFY
jgi:hypothetical protein